MQAADSAGSHLPRAPIDRRGARGRSPSASPETRPLVGRAAASGCGRKLPPAIPRDFVAGGNGNWTRFGGDDRGAMPAASFSMAHGGTAHGGADRSVSFRPHVPSRPSLPHMRHAGSWMAPRPRTRRTPACGRKASRQNLSASRISSRKAAAGRPVPAAAAFPTPEERRGSDKGDRLRPPPTTVRRIRRSVDRRCDGCGGGVEGAGQGRLPRLSPPASRRRDSPRAILVLLVPSGDGRPLASAM
jgi:hypothetical protein